MMALSPVLINDLVRAALKEDLGHGHDVTTQAVFSGGEVNNMTHAVLRARRNGVLAGMPIVMATFAAYDTACTVTAHCGDGALLKPGDEIAVIDGLATSILGAERVALNFLTHLSGIATLTRRYVDVVAGTDAKICDTRKTLPGLRAVQKYAVRMGGGFNHRFGLDDAVLIKDNHIAVAGGVREALDTVRGHIGHMVKIEIEVDTLAQLEAVLSHGGADVVMLDNFSMEDLEAGVDMVGGRMVTEASGGVMLDRVRDIAQTGVNYISVGALTHSAPLLDIGLDIDA